MTLYIVISTCVRDEIKMEEHPNIFAINFMKEIKTTRLKKKITSRLVIPDHIVIDGAYATGHILFKTFTNCQIYY